MAAIEMDAPQANVVVAKALANLKDELALSNVELGNIIGIDSSTVSRFIKKGELNASKPREAGLLLIRIYRSLYAILGGNVKMMNHWLRTENSHVHGIPLERIQSLVGLVEVVKYLDAMRGRA